ncbi:MAG: hypothetical protein ABJC13_11150 [Acidobacteriota bacterium]
MFRRPWLFALLLGLWAFPPAAVSAPSLRSISAEGDESWISSGQARSGRANVAHLSVGAHSIHRRIGKRGRPRLTLPARTEITSSARALPPDDVISSIDDARSSIPLRLRIHRFNE